MAHCIANGPVLLETVGPVHVMDRSGRINKRVFGQRFVILKHL